MPEDDITNLDQLAAVLAEDPRFSEYRPIGREPGGLELRAGEGSLALLEPTVWRDAARIEPHLIRSSAGSSLLILLGTDRDFAAAESLRDRAELALILLPISRSRLRVLLRNQADLAALRARAQERGRWVERYRYELGELIAIARAISSERDHNKLLGLVLEKCRYITGADAGSVYVVEGHSGLAPHERSLRFVASQNDSLQIDFREFTLPVDQQSIVGRTVISRELINVPDLYDLDRPGKNPWGFTHDKQFDRKTGYQGRSMLTVPMVNQDDEVIGVIQLINKRRDGAPRLTRPGDFDEFVVPFDKRSEELALTLASQAGISLENTLLYEDIRRLFDGFVNAAVTAIESRDPSTSGHSYRVATLTVGLAETVDQISSGTFAPVKFSKDDLREIEYAGLLHDFGKVGVRESVLVKAKKLYEPQREVLLARFDFIRKSIEAEILRRKLELIAREGMSAADRLFPELELELQAQLGQLDDYIAFILKANEPTVLPEGSFERLQEIAARTYVDPRGEIRPYLHAHEVEALKLLRGSLTQEERLEIESHVVHTYNFLENIPWGRRFCAIPEIAGSHHEKLDGTGYPRGLKGDEIRVESRMMLIADIFDALTASDRPYKKAVPVDKALDILKHEVKDGKADGELFQIFLDAKLWQRVIPD